MRKLLIAFVLLLGCWSAPALASITTTTITLDENNFTRELSATAVAGDVVICENGVQIGTFGSESCAGAGGLASDIVTFSASSLGGTNIFYCSDSEHLPGDAPADISQCNVIVTNTIFFAEASEGSNQVINYAPLPGQPGFVPDPFKYVIIGDTVANAPEPASLLLLSSGFCGLAAIRRRRVKTRYHPEATRRG